MISLKHCGISKSNLICHQLLTSYSYTSPYCNKTKATLKGGKYFGSQFQGTVYHGGKVIPPSMHNIMTGAGNGWSPCTHSQKRKRDCLPGRVSQGRQPAHLMARENEGTLAGAPVPFGACICTHQYSLVFSLFYPFYAVQSLSPQDGTAFS